MKKLQLLIFLIICSTLLLFSTSLHAQRIFELMETDGVTLKEVQDEAALYFAKVGTGKGTGYKLFKRWEYHALTNLKADGTIQSIEDHAAAIRSSKKSTALTNAKTNSLNHGDAWKTSAVSRNDDPSETGRITALYIEPINQQIIYASIRGDGLWKSSNGGNSWESLGNPFKNRTIFTIEVDPKHSSILYIGTEIGQLLKSIDHGLNFKVLWRGSSAVRELFIDPNDNNNIYAVLEEDGLYHTPDGGATWNQVVLDDHMDNVGFKSGSKTRVLTGDKNFYKYTKCIQYIDDAMYVTSNGRIYKSSTGASFIDISRGLGTP